MATSASRPFSDSLYIANEQDLNSAHPDFAKIATDPPALFHFDPRLFL